MKPTNKTESYIYKLVDPRDKSIKYVGATVNPKRRKGQHNRGEFSSKLIRTWVSELKQLNLKPIFSIIDVCPIEQSSNHEKYWIDYYSMQGYSLLNWDGVKRKYNHQRSGNLIKNIDS